MACLQKAVPCTANGKTRQIRQGLRPEENINFCWTWINLKCGRGKTTKTRPCILPVFHPMFGICIKGRRRISPILKRETVRLKQLHSGGLKYQHAVAKRIKAVFLFHRLAVGAVNKIFIGKGCYHAQRGGVRKMEIGDKAVYGFELIARVNK